jgi:hypothetical protein
MAVVSLSRVHWVLGRTTLNSKPAAFSLHPRFFACFGGTPSVRPERCGARRSGTRRIAWHPVTSDSATHATSPAAQSLFLNRQRYSALVHYFTQRIVAPGAPASYTYFRFIVIAPWRAPVGPASVPVESSPGVSPVRTSGTLVLRVPEFFRENQPCAGNFARPRSSLRRSKACDRYIVGDVATE